MLRIKSVSNNFCKDIIYLKWRTFYMCNYNCPYCIQVAQKKKENFNGELFEQEKAKAFSTAEKIDAFLAKVNPEGKNVSLEIIGGEVTLLDLVALLDRIKDKHINYVSITTNGSKPVDYFYNVSEYLHSRNCTFSVTMSYHDTQTTFEEFIYKASQLNKFVDEFSCEYVSRKDNQKNVQKFIDALEERKIDYKIEPDKTRNSLTERVKGELIVTSNFTNRHKARYDVVFEDDNGEETEKTYDCLAEMMNDKENGNAVLSKAIVTKGLYCTENYSYFYLLDNGNIRGGTIENPSCMTETPIEEFVPLEKPLKCVAPNCTCCGCMSLYKELPEEFNITNTEEC